MATEMKVSAWAVEKVIPYKGNPRKNEAAVDKVAASIKEFGFRVPIIVDKDGVIIAGRTRLLAALRLGMKEVPVHVAAGLTPAQVNFRSTRRSMLWPPCAFWGRLCFAGWASSPKGSNSLQQAQRAATPRALGLILDLAVVDQGRTWGRMGVQSWRG